VWPFPTKQLSAYLSSQSLVAWETSPGNEHDQLKKLSAIQLEELTQSIHVQGKLPPAMKRHKTTLRLAPSLGRCYTLQAANNKLGSSELKGLAEHWGKTFMGPKYSAWQWQAMQIQPGDPILLCACQVNTQYLNVFQTVKPELLNLIDSLKANESSWVICHDEFLVQSALVKDGVIRSIRTWPSHYTNHVKEVVEKHMLLADETRGKNIHHVVESHLGEVQIHGAA